MVISDANVEKACNEPIHLLPKECSQKTANEFVQENVNIDKIWKEELHFPRIETSKRQKRNVEPKIYAISSAEWKKQHEEKIRNQEEQQREKELRKLDREIKKKIKQEEIETKKKEREAKKELRLKKQAEMQIKKKEKEVKKELLKRRKAESLNLENNDANSAYAKRRVLKNITNSKITNNITEKNDIK